MPKLITIALLLLMLAGCSIDPNVEFIQGTWVSAEDAAAGGSGQLVVEWQFSRGSFVLQQQLDEDTWLYSQGSYRMVSSEGDVLMLELYDISGDRFTYNNLPETYKIEIDRGAGTIRVNSRLMARDE